ncbi:MAG: 3-deoxy-8-phosphooctulonate synthase [Verrucomicrobiia bacterium]
MKSRKLSLDEEAQSGEPGKPAFLARPKGAPVYYGFPVVAETETDGWVFGTITEYEDPNGCEDGDAFVVAPDGTRAGLVWKVGEGEISEICPPDEGRWGVYQVWFPKVIRTKDDLIFNFRSTLAQLKQIYERVKQKK